MRKIDVGDILQLRILKHFIEWVEEEASEVGVYLNMIADKN